MVKSKSMLQPDQVALKLGGCNIKIRSVDTFFLRFLQTFYEPFIEQEIGPCQIDVSFKEVEANQFESIAAGEWHSRKFRHLSRQVTQFGETVVIREVDFLPGLRLVVTLNGQTLKIVAYYEKSAGLVETIKQRIGGAKVKVKLASYLNYFLVIFPLLWYREYFENLRLVHASAIADDRNGLLLSGLGGVGKSTLAMAFLNQEKTTLLSDNLVLTDGRNIYPVYELIALDDTSLQMIGPARNKLLPVQLPLSHRRRAFRLRQGGRESTEAHSIFFIRQAETFSIEKITAAEALQEMLASNRLAKEVDAYQKFATWLNLAFKPIQEKSEMEIYRRLISTCTSYYLYLKPGMDLDKVVQQILQQTK